MAYGSLIVVIGLAISTVVISLYGGCLATGIYIQIAIDKNILYVDGS